MGELGMIEALDTNGSSAPASTAAPATPPAPPPPPAQKPMICVQVTVWIDPTVFSAVQELLAVFAKSVQVKVSGGSP